MGWKGALRSLEAASRRADREYKREQKRLAKQQELNMAALKVENFEGNLNSLITLHHTCLTNCDWKKINIESPPSEPVNLKESELKAEEKLKNFKPNFFHNLFNLTESKLNKLKADLLKAKQRDTEQYEKNLELYKNNYSVWEKSQKVSTGVLEGNLESYIEALKIINPYDGLEIFIQKLEFIPLNNYVAEITALSHGQKLIPNEIRSLLRSGKLSIKKMPQSKFYEIYQEHICSCTLRIAREIFAVLPLKTVIITIMDNLLNSQTGHLENQPILSVVIHKETLERLNFSLLDSSDAMGNFICQMNFKKNKGFEPVEKINSEKIINKV